MREDIKICLLRAVIQGPKKIMSKAEWRKDWWEFMDQLIDVYLVPKPKWMREQKEYQIH